MIPPAIRQNTQDLRIWQRVYDENCYNVPNRFNSGDVVLDVGAHTGSFSRLCYDKGARVFACEPCSKHHPLYYINTTDCTLFKVAVGEGSLLGYGKDPSEHSLVFNLPAQEDLDKYKREAPGSPVFTWEEKQVTVEEVWTVSLEVLVILLGRSIRFLKVSATGSEYSIFYGCHPEMLKYCQSIAVECTNFEGEKTNEEALRQYLVSLGYKLLAAKQLKKDHHLMRFELCNL